jgi:AraC-like DNA-binding protein
LKKGFPLLEKVVFASADLPAHLSEKEKFSLWQEIHLAEIWSVEYGISGNVPFEAEIEASAVGSLVVGQMAGSIKHARRNARNIAADGRDGYLLLVNTGDTTLSGVQVGREYSVGQGEAALVSASEPLEMIGGDRNVWMNIVVPRDLLADAFKNIDDRLAFRINAGNEALGLLRRYCDFLETGPPLVSPGLITHARETIVDLIGLVTGAKGEAAELAGLRGLRAARLQEIVTQIGANFADPTFNAHVVARKLGLSARYIQDLLQSTGLSFTERVMNLRLQKARAMLMYDSAGLKISDVAMSCGFNEVSYFHRSFRRRFGTTPVQYRGGGGAS